MPRSAGRAGRHSLPSRCTSRAPASSNIFAILKTRRASFTFYLDDCVRLMTGMAGCGHDSASVIVTSPPYNLGVDYRTYDDQLPREEYLQWTNRWVAAAAGILEDAGSLFLNVGHKPTDPWVAMDVAQAARRHLQLQNLVHWIKSIAIEEHGLAVGHYKPINSDRFVNDCHEFVFHFTPKGVTPVDRRAIGVPYQDKSNVARWHSARSDLRCRGNTWFIPYETIQSREKDRPHPATFPPALPEMCIRLHGISRARLVLDPFVGLGSTAVACARLGTSFVGIDLDEGYLAEAVARTTAVLKAAGEPFSIGQERESR